MHAHRVVVVVPEELAAGRVRARGEGRARGGLAAAMAERTGHAVADVRIEVGALEPTGHGAVVAIRAPSAEATGAKRDSHLSAKVAHLVALGPRAGARRQTEPENTHKPRDARPFPCNVQPRTAGWEPVLSPGSSLASR